MIKSITFRIVIIMNVLIFFFKLDLLMYVIVIVNTTERSFSSDSSV